MNSGYPNFETWRGIQGGEPIILSNQKKSMFHINHVYDSTSSQDDLTDEGRMPNFNSESAELLPHYGCVIDTPKQQFLDSCSNQVGLITPNNGSVTVPAVLLIDRHGKPCASRSKAGGYEAGYSKISNSKMWHEYLEIKAEDGWIVWAIGAFTKNQAKLKNKGPVRDFIY